MLPDGPEPMRCVSAAALEVVTVTLTAGGQSLKSTIMSIQFSPFVANKSIPKASDTIFAFYRSNSTLPLMDKWSFVGHRVSTEVMQLQERRD